MKRSTIPEEVTVRVLRQNQSQRQEPYSKASYTLFITHSAEECGIFVYILFKKFFFTYPTYSSKPAYQHTPTHQAYQHTPHQLAYQHTSISRIPHILQHTGIPRIHQHIQHSSMPAYQHTTNTLNISSIPAYHAHPNTHNRTNKITVPQKFTYYRGT